MSKNTINVQGIEVRVQQTAHGDFICLSDIAKVIDQPTSYTLRNWLRNRATVDFLGVWESAYNLDFNSVEFDAIRNESGTTAKNWKAANPDKKGNLRDFATVNELRVLANMETINATLIEQGFTKEERLLILSRRAEREFAILEDVKFLGEQKQLT